MSILGALTSWALEGSVVTADSMRSRGYGTSKRTSFHDLPHDRHWMLALLAALRGPVPAGRFCGRQ